MVYKSSNLDAFQGRLFIEGALIKYMALYLRISTLYVNTWLLFDTGQWLLFDISQLPTVQQVLHSYTLCGHKCQSIAVLNVRHDGNISIVSAQHFLQLCENLGILYQKLLHIINVTLTKSLGLDLR